MRHGTFAGRLGRDAELKQLPSGKDVVNFALAIDKGRGETKETLWLDCSLFGERAAKLQQYLVKGKSVTVAGDVDFRCYLKKDGTAGGTMTLDVQRLTLQGGRDAEQTEAPALAKPAMTPSTWSAPKQSRPAPPTEQSLNDEIPF
jgi:single-strand DNA-binding protein